VDEIVKIPGFHVGNVFRPWAVLTETQDRHAMTIRQLELGAENPGDILVRQDTLITLEERILKAIVFRRA
jgi:hypothetical protein